MCTVTFLARQRGYVLGMNRDEQRTRPAGESPRLRKVGAIQALFPAERTGGTWMGVNHHGITLALVNWYAVSERVSGVARSRGEVVREGLDADHWERVDRRLVEGRLKQVNPFRLLGIFPEQRKVVEWRWNLQRLERRWHPWRSGIWSSSGWDEPGAVKRRAELFQRSVGFEDGVSLAQLRRFHRSHLPAQGPYSPCMHREDAVTVSYTEVVVTSRRATLRHAQGSPCCAPLQMPRSLALVRA